ncbi:MAG TPA: NAD(P)/FAD-dependent oxidoreductase [Polyangiaceae bacterium]|nr:NAD(P)/FAD-dependent oxidoreductase [Polyangiaceae bacterium]
MTERADCVVIGGGPAGSTFAAIAAKYAPEANIILLEKEHFPRWHIGESTIPVANGVLRELGVFDALDAGLGVKKLGICFVWGQDRVPWNADYLSIATDAPAGTDYVIDVLGQDFSAFKSSYRPSPTPFRAFNIERSKFDHLLLNRARELGVDCREGQRVTEIVRERGRVSAVRYRSEADSAIHEIQTDFVLDASGLNALATRADRERDPHMNNFAVYGYFSGAEWKATYRGTREATVVFLASIPIGWIWYFPLADDVMSVGVVTHSRHFREELRRVDLEQFYWEALKSCPEVFGLLKQAKLRADILPQGRRVHTSQDWSSWARQPTGPGYAAAGDAAVFVDPILSSGVTLALQSGHRAAYTWLTARRQLASGAGPNEAELWQAYADYIHGEAGSFLTLARFFYGNNRAAESWWWQAQRLVNASGQLDLSDRQAFTLASAGFFPVPRAIGLEVVTPLVRQLTQAPASLLQIHDYPGIDRRAIGDGVKIRPLARFRLSLRAEPAPDRPGNLDLRYDLATDDPAFGHRIAVLPSRISPELRPLVEAMQSPCTVGDLLAIAAQLPHGKPASEPLGSAQIETESASPAGSPKPHPPEAATTPPSVRKPQRVGANSELAQLTFELVRRAAIKGFIALEFPNESPAKNPANEPASPGEFA